LRQGEKHLERLTAEFNSQFHRSNISLNNGSHIEFDVQLISLIEKFEKTFNFMGCRFGEGMFGGS